MKIRVKFLAPVYPYRKGEFGMVEESLATGALRNQVEIVEDLPKKEEKPSKTAGNEPNSSVSAPDGASTVDTSKNVAEASENKSMH